MHGDVKTHFKGMLRLKMDILSSFTHPVVPSVCVFFFPCGAQMESIYNTMKALH